MRIFIDSPNPVFTNAVGEQLSAAGYTLSQTQAQADMVLAQQDFHLPVRLAELLKAVRQSYATQAVNVGDGWVYKDRALSKGKETVALTEKEAQILAALLEAGTLSREALLEEVWGYGAQVETHTLETHIYRLRQKLETTTGHDRITTTEKGYTLTL